MLIVCFGGGMALTGVFSQFTSGVFTIDQTTGITPLTQEEQNAILQPNEIAENVIYCI